MDYFYRYTTTFGRDTKHVLEGFIDVRKIIAISHDMSGGRYIVYVHILGSEPVKLQYSLASTAKSCIDDIMSLVEKYQKSIETKEITDYE